MNMQIKTGSHNSTRKIPVKNRKSLIVVALAISSFIMLAGMAVASIVYAPVVSSILNVTYINYGGDDALTTKSRTQKMKEFAALGPINYIQSIRHSHPIDTIHFDIKFKNYERLAIERQKALRGNLISDDSKVFVPATLHVNNQPEHKVEIRLKGDMIDHLDTQKWSLRVKVKKDGLVYGNSRFSVQHPKTRSNYWETIATEHFRSEGVLAARIIPVRVNVNGKDLGIMLYEDHFSKQFMESQQRKESVIISFDETLWWKDRALNYSLRDPYDSPFFDPVNAPVNSFETSKVEKDPVLSVYQSNAIGLLRAFAGGRIPASEAFDAEILGKFLALAEVWDASHTIVWRNIRFYYNPISARLEPVAYDLNINSADYDFGELDTKSQLAAAMLDDSRVADAYRRYIDRYAPQMASGQIRKKYSTREKYYLELMHREFPLVSPLPFAKLEKRAATLRKRVENMDEPYPLPDYKYHTPVIAYDISSDRGRYVEISNPNPFSITVLSVTGSSASSISDSRTVLPVIMPPYRKNQKSRTLAIPVMANSGKVYVNVVIDANGKKFKTEAKKSFPAITENMIPKITAEQVLRLHPFLTYSSSSSTATIKSGVHRVSGNLILPQDIKLVAGAGVTLEFAPDAVMIVKGPMEFRGAAEAPVTLKGIGSAPWAGFSAQRSGRASIWENVKVLNTTGVKLPGWEMTGGVNFHRHEITLRHVEISGTKAEDCINIVHSSFRACSH